MNRHTVLTAIFATAGFAASCATGCGGGGGSSGGSSITSSSSGSSGSSGSSSGTSSSSCGGTGASTACTSNQGTIVPVKWDFASSAATLNGGKGQVLSIHVCDTVEWTNDDNAVQHSVVSTGGGFDFSTPLATGTTAGVLLGRVQFPTAGTFTYHCGIHPTLMIGQVTVQ